MGIKALCVVGVVILIWANVSMYFALERYREIERDLVGPEKPAEYFYQKYKDYGNEYKYRRESEHGMMCLGIAAHMGLDDAQARIGNYLLDSMKSELDRAHALQWKEKAAAQGKAEHCFGYAESIGFPVEEWSHPTEEERAQSEADCKVAFGLYLKAAEQGHVGAMKKAALWYNRGIGCEQNPEEALRWAKKAYEIELEEYDDNYEAYAIGAIYMGMGRPDLAKPYLELRAIYGDPRAEDLWFQANRMLDKQKKEAEAAQK